ncbi:MAG: sensor histidine kinase [Planctomycetota bacterium]
MSLRLRILLLVAVVNVGVLLLVVQVGLGEGRDAAPVPPAAVTEALGVALKALKDGPPDTLEGTYVESLVLVPAYGTSYEMIGPPGAQGEVEALGESLRQRVAEGRTGNELDADGLSMVVGADEGPWAAAYVGFGEQAAWEARAGLRRTYVVLAAGTVLLIGATYLFLRAVVLRPLERLEEASRAVEEGWGTPPKVPVPRGGGEMARLIENFNRMATEVQEYQAHLEDRVLDTLRRVTSTERRLVVAQRLAATGTLAAGFAHEINNPVGGVLNAVRRLRQGGLSPERREEYFELVQDGVDRIRTIVERILHFTPRQQDPAPVDVAEVCERAVALAGHRAERAQVELKLDLEPPLDGVVGDSQELTQAVLNLVFNAIDAIPEGRAGHVLVSARTEDADVRIEVEDDGVGMDAETAQRCVDLFFSTKREGEGTGLGLGIVQHIVIDHGGSLEIDSEPDRGTHVRMRLPRGMDR